MFGVGVKRVLTLVVAEATKSCDALVSRRARESTSDVKGMLNVGTFVTSREASASAFEKEWAFRGVRIPSALC